LAGSLAALNRLLDRSRQMTRPCSSRYLRQRRCLPTAVLAMLRSRVRFPVP